MDTVALEVLDFWFGPPTDPQHGLTRAEWFRKDPAFDERIRVRFGPLVDEALTGGIDHWLSKPVDALQVLAQVIVLDQFPRNLFRGDARAFAGDGRALLAARALVATGADRTLSGVQRQFAYLPFEHSEDLPHQRTAVQLFTQLAADEPALAGLVDWARRHHDVIARFGRFPHRNAALGRPATGDEQAFLATPGSGF